MDCRPSFNMTGSSISDWFQVALVTLSCLATAGGSQATPPAPTPPPSPAIGGFSANVTTVKPGETVTLSWTGIANATNCAIDNGVGSVSCSDGSAVAHPASTTTYTFAATGAGGAASRTATVTVGVSHGSQTFDYTGGAQTFVVPPGITSVTIDAYGANGGGDPNDLPNAKGGEVIATIAVTSGETLVILVGGLGGQFGPGGFNGGGDGGSGGGGASDVRQGGSALPNRVVLAAGGGGATSVRGGDGGGTTGAAGGSSSSPCGGSGGQGATSTAGGAGGMGGSCPIPGQPGGAGSNGDLGIGGIGGLGAGGGGGGYFGGGGGAGGGRVEGLPLPGGAGGGGSSYAVPGATNVSHHAGVWDQGHGRVTISW